MATVRNFEIICDNSSQNLYYEIIPTQMMMMMMMMMMTTVPCNIFTGEINKFLNVLIFHPMTICLQLRTPET